MTFVNTVIVFGKIKTRIILNVRPSVQNTVLAITPTEYYAYYISEMSILIMASIFFRMNPITNVEKFNFA